MNRTRTIMSIVLLGVLLTSWGGVSPTRVQAQAWLGWPYRCQVTISNTSGSPLTQYQVLVTLNASNFSFGHALGGQDVRITDSDGVTLLPFWIEEWNTAGSLARIWVKVPSIPAGGTATIYLYYGNPAALAASDGDATFELFDDDWRQFGGGEGNPVHTAGQPWWESTVSFPVVFEDTSFPDRPRFHMLYDGHNVIGHAKGYATSPDLIHWTEYDAGTPHPPNPNPIMGTGYAGNYTFAWGDTMKVGSTYYMYVSRGPGTIYRTESTDLITWTNFQPITGGSFGTGAAILKEGDGITPIAVDGRYWMVYFPTGSPGSMYLASAPVGGDLLAWEPYGGVSPIPILAPTVGGWDASGLWTPSFARLGDYYYIYYQGNGPAGWETGFAKAAAYDGGAPIRPDAVTWTKSADSVIKNGSGWDSTYCIDPMIREFDGTYYVFYTGNVANGYAHSTSPEGPWIKLGEEGGVAKWQTLAGSPTVVDGALRLASGASIRSIVATYQYLAVGYRANFPSPSSSTTNAWGGFINGSANDRTMIGMIQSSLQLRNLVPPSGTESRAILTGSWFGGFHVYEVLWRSGQSTGIVDHGASTASLTAQVPSAALPLTFYNYNSATPVLVDWAFVRKYSYPEPTATVLGEVTAVKLVSWTASPAGKAILLEWETATEVDNLGFNLYRDDRADGPFARLNDTLIPSQAPGSMLGAVYSWLDGDVQPGVTYYYKLEDVDIYGNRTQHGPVWVRAYLHIYLPLVVKN
jgi:hypothetical protein